MTDCPKIKRAPGLTWKREGGTWKARWRARKDIVLCGYPTKSVVVWTGGQPTETEVAGIRDQCERLQREMLVWERNGGQEIRASRYAGRLGYVYFITDGEKIKIGYSLDVKGRRRTLQREHHLPLRTLAYFVGMQSDEAALHSHFKEIRLDGEWFEPSRRIDRMIARLETGRRLLESRQATIPDMIRDEISYGTR